MYITIQDIADCKIMLNLRYIKKLSQHENDDDQWFVRFHELDGHQEDSVLMTKKEADDLFDLVSTRMRR